MPRWLRIALTGLSFAMFFSAGLVFGSIFTPVVFLFALGNRERQRRWCTWIIGRAYGTFLFWMKLAGLIAYRRFEPPPEIKDKAYVLVANHPSLIDVLFLLYFFRGATCIVKASWYRSWLVRALLRSTHYLPGPGFDEEALPDDGAEAPVLGRMVAHLEAGHPLQIFPEGTRSLADRLRRYKRGAFEAAIRAGVPVVAVFVSIDRPFLMKGVPFHRVPKRRAAYDFEILRVVHPGEYTSSLALRNDLQAAYQQRFERMLAERVESEWASVPSSAVPAPALSRGEE